MKVRSRTEWVISSCLLFFTCNSAQASGWGSNTITNGKEIHENVLDEDGDADLRAEKPSLITKQASGDLLTMKAVSATPVTITGKVVDETGESMIGVNIQIEGTAI